MKKDFCLVIVLFLSSVTFAGIAPIVVELPGLTGTYNWESYKKVNVDVSQQLNFEVGSVSLTIEGTYTNGSRFLEETGELVPLEAGLGGVIEEYWEVMNLWGYGFDLTPNFKIESFFERIGNPDWDFLSSGAFELPLGFGGSMSDNERALIQQFPHMELTNVTLTIYPIPEPMTICLFALGGVMMRRKKVLSS